jgi:cysteine desulfurase
MHKPLPLYLDYAASTPLDPRVIKVLRETLESPDLFGNASSQHYYGWRAAELIEAARLQVAMSLQADVGEIIWTSGATESNNLALKGAAYFYRERGRHIITMQTEHKAVLDTCAQLEREGFEVTYLPVQTNGLLDIHALQKALRKDTILVSVMQVNNETGVIQDIKSIAEIVKQHGALFHVDAAQSMGKVALNVQDISVDFVSLSAHKVYGPKGVGALYVRRKPRARLLALLQGGGHEQGLRSGTLPTHQIVAMGEAFKIAREDFLRDHQHIALLRKQLLEGLKTIPGIIFNGALENSVPGIVNFSCQAVEGESLLLAIQNDLAVSSGSACTTATIEPSHVLRAMKVSDELAHSSLRISYGRFTTSAEIEKTIVVLRKEIVRLRELGSAWV